MPKQMWFGNERHMQWVPCPATGMQVRNVGVSKTMQYDNGRMGVVRTHQTHKEYQMEFPVQDASGLEGLDIFGQYAAGFYSDMDVYPVHFADPMNYDTNLFPAEWASPKLVRRGWASIADTSPRSYLNLATNPSVELASTGWASVSGTGGTATGARTSVGTAAVAGTYVFRTTWTVATTAVAGGMNYIDTPASAGNYYGVDVYVRSSKIQRVAVTMRYRNSSNTSLSTVQGTQVVLAANTNTKLTVDPNLAPANTDTVDIEIAAVSGTSGVFWVAADTFQADAVFIYQNQTGNPGSYFDGDYPGAAWTGTAHASRSAMYTPEVTVTTVPTAANSYNVPDYSGVFNIISPPNAYPTGFNTFGDIPFALIPIPPGYTLWLGAYGSATGTAVVRVHTFVSPGEPTAPITSTALTLLSPTGAVRLNASFSGSSYEFVKVFLQRTSTAASTITLAGMMAQLWPTGVTPVLSTTGGQFVPGQGHRGLKFTDDAVVESYVMTNRHLKGLSTTLVESRDRG